MAKLENWRRFFWKSGYHTMGLSRWIRSIAGGVSEDLSLHVRIRPLETIRIGPVVIDSLKPTRQNKNSS